MKTYTLLAEIIEAHPHIPLRKVKLEGNFMGNQAAGVLLYAVNVNTKLRFLDISKNNLTDSICP